MPTPQKQAMTKALTIAWENFRQYMKPAEGAEVIKGIFSEAFHSGFVNGIDYERTRRNLFMKQLRERGKQRT